MPAIRTSFVSLLLLSVSLLQAKPQITEVRHFSPPIPVTADSPLSKEPWYPAFIASLAPSTLSFSQWAHFHSARVISLSGLNESNFSEYLAAQSQEPTPQDVSEIIRVTLISDEGEAYLKITEKLKAEPSDEATSTFRSHFLKQEPEGWINWLIGADTSPQWVTEVLNLEAKQAQVPTQQ